MPGRHDPEFGCDFNRRELRLRQPHPILVGHRRHANRLAALKEILRREHLQRVVGRSLRLEQGDYPRALPAIFGRRHAGFAKQGLFIIGLRVGIFHTHTEGVQRLQRVA